MKTKLNDSEKRTAEILNEHEQYSRRNNLRITGLQGDEEFQEISPREDPTGHRQTVERAWSFNGKLYARFRGKERSEIIDYEHFQTWLNKPWPKALAQIDAGKEIPSHRERKLPPPPKSHIFPPILTIFELVHEINKTNILTNHVRKTAPPPGGHNSVEIHEDRARNAVSSVHKAKFHDGHRSIKYHH
ncbi:hypothetical protein DPMN_107313 [Dreissena polymorpha]|uniref:Uncharacterized protein n=1 Tax=Dreissena polymorpha TaxID=45954 RepID=A0A9D4K6P9_DREPO|nr:hypothetical protein DPMN_107313 [Dreissena polymorpha]